MASSRSLFALFVSAAAAAAIATALARGNTAESDPTVVRFAMLEVVLETGEAPLAAYQIEIRATAGDVRIVGIEGGEHAAYAEPPYYDAAAMQEDRVIIAAFSTAPASELPTGSTRVATIHVRLVGDVVPDFATSLEAAASADERPIDARITCTLRSAP